MTMQPTPYHCNICGRAHVLPAHDLWSCLACMDQHVREEAHHRQPTCPECGVALIEDWLPGHYYCPAGLADAQTRMFRAPETGTHPNGWHWYPEEVTELEAQQP